MEITIIESTQSTKSRRQKPKIDFSVGCHSFSKPQPLLLLLLLLLLLSQVGRAW